MTKATVDTRERLLAAAERLLLESGYDDVSVRAVCTAADANPAAVHYHFGSKEALVAALLQSRLGPIWEAPIRDLVARNGDVADCVAAVLDPIVELAADPAGRLHLNLLARLVLGRRDVAWTAQGLETAQWFGIDPWARLLRRNVAGLSDRDAKGRWMLAFELILGQFGDPLAGDRVLSPAAVAVLRSFVTAGLSAPA